MNVGLLPAGVRPHSISERGDVVGNEDATDILHLLHMLIRNLRPSPSGLELNDGNRIAPRHVQVLIHLGSNGQLSVSEIAQKLGVNLTTASLSVAQLAQAGMVERSEDPKDHRRTIVKISDRYEKISKLIIDEKVTPLQRVLDEMGPEKTKGLTELLSDLNRRLSSQPEFYTQD